MCAGTETEGIGNILYQLPAIYIYIYLSTNRLAESHTDNNTSSKNISGHFGVFNDAKQN